MRFESISSGGRPGHLLQFILETLQSSIEYSLVGESLDGEIVLWNEGARRLYGYRAEEVVGKPVPALSAPEDGTQAAAAMKVALQLGKWEGLLTQVRKNGERFQARTSIAPRFDAAGELTGYLRICQEEACEAPAQAEAQPANATAANAAPANAPLPHVEAPLHHNQAHAETRLPHGRAHAEAPLAEEKFSAFLESAPDSMLVVLDGRIVVLNSQTEKLFGYSREELIGQTVEFLIPERFRAAHPAHRAGYSAQPHVRPMGQGRELFGMRRDGSEFPVEISLSPFETEGRRYTISAVRDVTFRKKVEERFRLLLESAPDAMVIINHEGHILLVNSQAEKLFGYGRAEMLGQPVEMLVPERFRHSHSGFQTSYLHAPRLRPMGSGMELCGLRKDGSEFPAEIGLSPLDTEEGLLVSSSIRDMTERQRFERALREKNVELENASLAKDRFLSSMSHELRTPLNAIIGFTGTLLMKLPGPLLPQQEKHLKTVQSSARHLLSLINDLLDLAKIQSGKVEILLEPVECLGVVEEVAAALRPAAEAKSLAFEARVDPPQLAVRADRRALSQILLNLAGNAIKFTQRGTISVRAAQCREDGRRRVSIGVSDTGVGIREEDQAKLFQAFSQVDSPGALGGTGLGLHLSRKLAELLGGEITLHSESGQGSIFTLFLEEA